VERPTSNQSRVDVTYETRPATSASGAGRVVELVDRYFVLVSIAFFSLLPVSGWAEVMFRSWADQRRDLAALRSVISVGHAEAIAQNGIGPAYIAAGRMLHDVLGLTPEDALVALTRGSYVLAAALGVVLVRVVVRGLTGAPPMVTLGAQFAFVGLVFAVGTWHWSDVPWSHFFAAFLAVAVYALRFAPSRLTVASAGALGVAVALLMLTRSFELLAVLLAWGIVAAAFALLRLCGPRTLRLGHVVSGVGAFILTSAAVYLLTGKRNLFFLYGERLDQQSGNSPAAEIAETPTFSFSLVPTKLVQLFVEPCYGALCSLSDYTGGARPLPPDLLPSGVESGGNERLWRLPLAIQLPSLVLLPLCLLAVAAIVVWAVRHRAAARADLRVIRLMAEMSIASAGIVLGYSASTLTGSPHLRYGFSRDFLLPALLIGIVAVGLISAGLWLVLRRARFPVSPEFVFVVVSVVGSACLVVGLAYARANGIPRIESRQLGAVTYTASCRGAECEIAIAATTTSGQPISIPESSTLTFGCGSRKPRFTVYAEDPTAGVRLTEPCPDPRLVAAWPTVMGLPPGSFELSAVDVRNA
jgi:hypothetical protein